MLHNAKNQADFSFFLTCGENPPVLSNAAPANKVVFQMDTLRALSLFAIYFIIMKL